MSEISTMSPRSRVEAILLVHRESLSYRRLAQLAGLDDATAARTICRELNARYLTSGQSIAVMEAPGGVQLMTRPQFARWLRTFEHVRPAVQLTQIALETLAIVAYRQPVIRAYIESVRGAGCDEILRQLLDADLIRIAGRSEELGRPYVYRTTKRFLQVFGLRSLDDLPKKDWVLAGEHQFPNGSGADSMLDRDS